MSAPKVSVCVVTYNQEKYIAQCLESLVSQETDFNYEIIVCDDGSTDDTSNIIRLFSEKYSTIIKPIYHKENIGASKNYIYAHKMASGEYIAHMDGDDYALPGKLQKQVNFLDTHPECSFVCHRVHLVTEDGKKIIGFQPEKYHPEIVKVNELLRNYLFFTHSSKMYRRAISTFNYEQMSNIIDFFLHVEHALKGDIGFIPDVLGGYRTACGGLTSAKGEGLYILFDLTLDVYDYALQFGITNVLQYKSKYLIKCALFCISRNDVAGYWRYMNMCAAYYQMLGGYKIIYFIKKHLFFLKVLLKFKAYIRLKSYYFKNLSQVN